MQTLHEQFIVDKNGNPTAVILPIAEYRKMLSALGKTESEEPVRTEFESRHFRELVQKGLEDIRQGRTRLWKEIWDEI